jgi:hypothetical protein
MTKFKFEVGDAVREPMPLNRAKPRPPGKMSDSARYLCVHNEGYTYIKYNTIGLVVKRIDRSVIASRPANIDGYYILFGDMLVYTGMFYTDKNMVKA